MSSEMAPDVAIQVQGLAKCYHIYNQPRDRLLEWAWRGKKRYSREFWALKDLSFEVKKGETLGVVGRNGSGKSTLLQLICGTLTPTQGRIQTRGRIAALLELGSGFNPEFSGRENVYLNAMLMGLTKAETEQKLDAILAFADIGDFIDQPVKTYSSGMMLRLAFAVQAQIDPDILIVDEALAVGDARFQAKCFDRLRQLKEQGTSILLVTHSTEQIVTHCSEALLLDQGLMVQRGAPRQVVNRYMDLLFGRERLKEEAISPGENPSEITKPQLGSNTQLANKAELSFDKDCFASRTGYNPHEYRWGDGSAEILDFSLYADDELYPTAISIGQQIRLNISMRFNRQLVCPILGITIKTKEGVTVYGANSESLAADSFRQAGEAETTAQVEASFVCRLAPGDYFVSLGLATKNGEEVIPHDRRYDAIHLQVRPDARLYGLIDLGMQLQSCSYAVQ